MQRGGRGDGSLGNSLTVVEVKESGSERGRYVRWARFGARAAGEPEPATGHQGIVTRRAWGTLTGLLRQQRLMHYGMCRHCAHRGSAVLTER